MKLTVEVPTRVDLAGGTLDIYPLTEVLEYSCTINVGVNLSARVSIEAKDGVSEVRSMDQRQTQILAPQWRSKSQLPLISEIYFRMWEQNWPSVLITTSCQSPSGAGLGGSSALGIGVATALNLWAYKNGWAEKLSEKSIVAMVQSIETRVIHCPTGCQDYWGAVRGRINLIHFNDGSPVVETLNAEDAGYLKDRLILCYSGKSRASGMNNWSIFKQVFDGDKTLIQQLNSIGKVTQLMAKAIKQKDWPQAVDLSGEEWVLRKQLWPHIETSETRSIDELALAAGAKFTRVCGAGGGGVMAILVEPDKYEIVRDRLQNSSGSVLQALISDEGIRAQIID